MKFKKLTYLILLLCLSTLASGQDLHKAIQKVNIRSIGPAGMSGRVTSIDVDPFDQSRILIGTASGGVWMSDDGGVAWKSIADTIATQSIGSVAFDPSRKNVIWVGTGEGNPRNSHNSGKGVYQSKDGGLSWRLMGLEKTKVVHRIWVNPRNPEIVYFGCLGSAWGAHKERGVYRTTDDGKTFEKVLFVNDSTGCADLIMDPHNPDKLIAAMWEHKRRPFDFVSGGVGSDLYVTLDGGNEWKRIRDNENCGLPKGDLGRIGLTVSAANSDVIYALVEAKKNGLYKSVDGGWNWSLVSDKNIGNRPFYYADIFADPNNENVLYNLYSVLDKSIDGGKHFETIATYSSIHPDHHAFWINPKNSDHVIDGNDGGLNISYDGGKTWRFIRNLPLGQFYHIHVDEQLIYNIYGGLQDNGSWVGPSNVFRRGGIRASDWQEVLFGDGFDVVPIPDDYEYVYAMYQGGNVYKVHVATGKSDFIKPTAPADTPELRFNWDAAIAIDPFDPNAVYFGSQYLHYSKDQGKNWTILSPDLSTNDTLKQQQAKSGGLTIDATAAENYTTITCMAPSPFQKGTIWVGTDDGRIHYTKSGGDSWSEVTDLLPQLPEHAWIHQIRYSTLDSNRLYIVANNYRQNDWEPYVYKSLDGGKSWTSIHTEDIDGHAWAIVEDKENPQLLFLGTDFGLYYSLDKGNSWAKWKSFPSAPVRDLQIQHKRDDLVIGTFGRSIYILDDLEIVRALAENKLDSTQVIYAASGYRMHYRSFEGERFAADAHFQGSGSSFAPYVAIWKGADSLSLDTNAKSKLKKDKKMLSVHILNEANDTIRSFERKLEEGVNKIYWGGRGDGIRFPKRAKEEKEDQLPPAGTFVNAGRYKVKLSYQNWSDQEEILIQSDPRMESDRNYARVQFGVEDYQKEVLDSFFYLVESLKSSRENIHKIKVVFDGVEEKDSIAMWVKPVEKKLGRLLDEVFGPKKVKGLDVVSKYLLQEMRIPYQYLMNGQDPETSLVKHARSNAEEKLSAFQMKTEKFFSEEWKDFQEKVNTLEPNLFKE